MPPWSRILRALFVAFVAATAVHIGWVMAHEPFSFDAWNIAVDTHGEPFTLERFFRYWWFQYTHSNPRIGQPLTYIAYKLDWFAEVVMPLAYLALSLAVTVLGLGRFPRRGRELAMWTIAIGFGWFALPEIGRNMFCRAYGINYVVGAAIQLWFLVPLRIVRTPDAPIGRCLLYGGFGLIAGMCNEHTGPALLAFLAGYAWWLRRAGVRPRLVWAGAAGVVVGFLALFLAPGQGERYQGLVHKVSLPMRLAQRAVVGNLDIVRQYVLYAAPLLALIVIVLIWSRERGEDGERRERALRFISLAMAAGLALAVTLFVSPKLGSRFYLVSGALLLAGFIALVDAVMIRPRQLAPLVALAVAASLYAGARTIPVFLDVAVQADQRIAALETLSPGDTFVAEAWEQVDESWWFIGDDFRDVLKRELVARYLGLARVGFRGYDRKTPLGLLGSALVPRFWTESRSGIDPTFDVSVGNGLDLAAVHRATQTSIELLRAGMGHERLLRFELGVEFNDGPPPLPRAKLLLSRWREGRFEGYVATFTRDGRVAFDLALPEGLTGRGFEIYVSQIGGEVRRLGPADGSPLHYVTWRKGVYWVLACDADECWVIAAMRHGTG